MDWREFRGKEREGGGTIQPSSRERWRDGARDCHTTTKVLIEFIDSHQRFVLPKFIRFSFRLTALLSSHVPEKTRKSSARRKSLFGLN